MRIIAINRGGEERYLLYSSGLLIRVAKTGHPKLSDSLPMDKPSVDEWNSLVVVNDAVREILGEKTLNPGYIKKIG